MSDDTPTQTGELGEMPEPSTEPREPNPGGVDAQPDDAANIPADLDPESNPAAEDNPEPLNEGEDTATEATQSGDAGEAGDVPPEEEAPV
jgi:hypothetical protein